MSLSDTLRELGAKVLKLKPTINSEEATKTAFVMPFIRALEYDVFDPLEVVPEFVADVGIKKGEKIDYCILKDNKPIILIECKHWRENLNDHGNQLHRYFYATSARIAILTNGVTYRFYADLEQKNKMDESPFLEFDITSLTEDQIENVEKYRKSKFDVGEIFSKAIDLKIRNDIIKILNDELLSPSDQFVKFFLRKIHKGAVTKRVMFQFRGIITETLNKLLNTSRLAEHNDGPTTIDKRSNAVKTKETSAYKKSDKNQAPSKEKVIIGNDVFDIRKSYEVLIRTAEWLIQKGGLHKNLCPLATSKKRYLVNTIPKHQNGNDFFAPKKLSNGLFIETHCSAVAALSNSKKLLKFCGYEAEMLKLS